MKTHSARCPRAAACATLIALAALGAVWSASPGQERAAGPPTIANAFTGRTGKARLELIK